MENKYKHLTAEQRYTIDRLLRQNKGRKEIALTIDVSESTLSRELKHNSGKRGYHWKQAQAKAKSRPAKTAELPQVNAGNPQLHTREDNPGAVVARTDCGMAAQERQGQRVRRDGLRVHKGGQGQRG